MALTWKTRWLVVTGVLAATAMVWPTDTESLGTNTQTFGRDRIVSWTSLPSAGAAALPTGAACPWPPGEMAGAAAFQGRSRSGAARDAEPGAAITPTRVIQGPRTEIRRADRVAVDPLRKEIFVGDGGQVLVFPTEANGDVAPIRAIRGPDTHLGGGGVPAIVVDAKNQTVIITDKELNSVISYYVPEVFASDGPAAVSRSN